jgi:hypothetical protein
MRMACLIGRFAGHLTLQRILICPCLGSAEIGNPSSEGFAGIGRR